MPIANLLQAVDINGVEAIWPDLEVKALDEGALQQINAKQAWQLGYTGQGAKIAVLDTGIDETHNALAGKIIASANFSDSSTTSDLQGHGTHVAGIIAGYGDANGVAPNAQLLNGKVLNDSGSGTMSSVIAGINWAVEQGAEVINLSLGATSHETNTPLNQAIRDAVSQGVIVVIASGNCGECGNCNGFFGVTMPGNTKEAITIGAIDSSNAHACFSSGESLAEGIKPDVVAPGVGIISSIPNNGIASKSGTSMATPFVTGAIALLLEKYPSLTPFQAKKWLEINALDLGSEGKDVLFGSGLVDAKKIFESDISIADENSETPVDKNIVDFNVSGLGFSFTGPGVLNKKQEGSFVVETGTSGNALAANEVSLEKDCTIEFTVFDEFGNIVATEAIGPKIMTELIPQVFEYKWKSQRTGNFTIKATAYVEGEEVSVFSTQESIKTASIEKQVKVTVPNDLVQAEISNSPLVIQKGRDANIGINVLANSALLGASSFDEEYSFRAPIEICAAIDLQAGDLIWIKNIDFSGMGVQADLRDVRIVNENTSTELNRKAEGTSASIDGNVFFAIDGIVQKGLCDTSYRLYYSNASATAVVNSASNLDDFESYAVGSVCPFGSWFTTGTYATTINSGQHKSSNKSVVYNQANQNATVDWNISIPNFDNNLGLRTVDYNAWAYINALASFQMTVQADSNTSVNDAVIETDYLRIAGGFVNNNSLDPADKIISPIDGNHWYKISMTYTWKALNHQTCIYQGTDTNLLVCGIFPNRPTGSSGIPRRIGFNQGEAKTSWLDDVEFFAPYQTNVSLGPAEAIGGSEKTDINAIVNVFVKDESNEIVGFLGSSEKNLLKDANNLFEFNSPLELPAGDYNLEAVVLFEDQNISIKKPISVSVEGFTGIESFTVPLQGEINSLANFKVKVKNNSAAEIKPFVLLQISDESGIVSSIADFDKTILAGQTLEYSFDWNANVKAKAYDANAIVILDNTRQSTAKQIQIIDSRAPEIKSIVFSSTAKQFLLNKIEALAFDSSEISSATAIATAPSTAQEQIELTKGNSTMDGTNFTGAFSKLKETGNYSVRITACDEFGNCITTPEQGFVVSAQSQNCKGKNVLVVLDNDSFSLQHNGQEWAKDLNSLDYCFSFWETKGFGSPALGFLQDFNAVIWSSGNNFGYAIDASDSAMLESLLQKGAKILVEGSDVSSEHGFDSFAEKVLHAEFLKEGSESETSIAVDSNNILGLNIATFAIDFNKAEFFDFVKPIGGVSIAGFDENNSVIVAWESASSGSKTLFFSFSFDALGAIERSTILESALDWLSIKPAVVPCGGADIDRDRQVTVMDVITIINKFGNTCSAPGWCENADIDRDGIVSVFEVIEVINNFGCTYN